MVYTGPTRNSTRHAKRLVKHDYHDHSQDWGEETDPQPQDGSQSDPYDCYESTLPSTNTSNMKNNRRGPRGGVKTPFPIKLHMLLESGEHSDIIHWQPHGRCFALKKPNQFLKIVMPQYFRQTKLTSFQRQLNLYGFNRLYSGSDKGSYYHELFLRGRPHLCKRMIRMRIKGNGTKAGSNPRTEPNFYRMPPVMDLPTASDADYKADKDCNNVPSSIVLDNNTYSGYDGVEASNSTEASMDFKSNMKETTQQALCVEEMDKVKLPCVVSSSSEAGSMDGSASSTTPSEFSLNLEQDPLHFLDYGPDSQLSDPIVTYPPMMDSQQGGDWSVFRQRVSDIVPDTMISYHGLSQTMPPLQQASYACPTEEQLYL